MLPPQIPGQAPPLGVGPLPPAQPQPAQAIQGIQGLQPQTPQLTPELLGSILTMQDSQSKAERAALKAAALRKETPSEAAAGPGPSGIRIGEGRGGWAVSLGDLAGGLVQRAHTHQAEQAADIEAGVQSSVRKQGIRDLAKAGGFVPQGTPLTSALPQGGGDTRSFSTNQGGTGLLSL